MTTKCFRGSSWNISLRMEKINIKLIVWNLSKSNIQEVSSEGACLQIANRCLRAGPKVFPSLSRGAAFC